MKRKHAAYILGFAFVMILLTLGGSHRGRSNPALPEVKRTHPFEIIWGSEFIHGAGTRWEVGMPLIFLVVDGGSIEQSKAKKIGETDSDRARRDVRTWRFKLDIAKLLYDLFVVGAAYCSIILLMHQLLKGLQRIKRGHYLKS